MDLFCIICPYRKLQSQNFLAKILPFGHFSSLYQVTLSFSKTIITEICGNVISRTKFKFERFFSLKDLRNLVDVDLEKTFVIQNLYKMTNDH